MADAVGLKPTDQRSSRFEPGRGYQLEGARGQARIDHADGSNAASIRPIRRYTSRCIMKPRRDALLRPGSLTLTLLAGLASLAACGDGGAAPAPESRRTVASRSASTATSTPSASSTAAASASASATSDASAESSSSSSAPASSAGATASGAASVTTASASVSVAEAPPASASASAAASSAAPAETVMGKQQGAGQYSAWLQSAGRYTAGQPGSVTVVLTAKGDFHCNDKYPFKLKLDPPQDGVSYPDSTVRGMVVGPSRSTMSVPFVPSKPGPVTISGNFYFSVCNEASCKIDQAPLSVTVKVE